MYVLQHTKDAFHCLNGFYVWTVRLAEGVQVETCVYVYVCVSPQAAGRSIDTPHNTQDITLQDPTAPLSLSDLPTDSSARTDPLLTANTTANGSSTQQPPPLTAVSPRDTAVGARQLAEGQLNATDGPTVRSPQRLVAVKGSVSDVTTATRTLDPKVAMQVGKHTHTPKHTRAHTHTHICTHRYSHAHTSAHQ